MGSVKLHARLLAVALLALGVGSMLYQVWVQQVPLTKNETDPVWTVDAQVDFDAPTNVPIKVRMFVPPLNGGFTQLNESFISNNYGVRVNRAEDNRLATWSARRGSGAENLYYRLTITPRFADGSEQPEDEGPQFRDSPSLDGPDKVAADALLKPIREQSADVETFVSETIKRVNDTNNDNVHLLLGGDASPHNRARVVILLLAEANIPVEPVHTLKLESSRGRKPDLWLRTYNGQRWLYFNPVSGQEGLPEDELVWWVGDAPLLSMDGGRNATVKFSVQRSEMGALQLAQALNSQDRQSFIGSSLYGVPLSTQQLLKVIVMIPIGVLIVLLMRSIVGIETLGTFTPVLVALALRETQIIWGILLFVGITTIGLTVRAYLDHLKLQLLARLSVMLTFVVMVMAFISLVSYKLGVTTGLSVALFPMVILTMMIERVSIVWDERGGPESIKVGLATLGTAIICHLIMTRETLVYLLFTFPGILLMLAGIMILIGHYRGYRLSELIRFRVLAREAD